ncbi:MAG: yvoA [Capsulimonas sp.]|jgi:hypothetical protein|nr:yvoA [Capsulimonas sp.]
MAKVDQIKELLELRILRGDYALTPFPSEVRLSEEVGASRTTVRLATLSLIEKGLLHREISGRLSVAREPSDIRPLHIGLLLPSLHSTVIQWEQAAEIVIRSNGGHVRTVTFFHWDDPVLLDAIESFDGIFLVPPAEPMPVDLAAKLRAARTRLAILADYSALGLHGLGLAQPGAIPSLLDHLADLGHKRVAAFNTQPLVTVIEQRMDQWSLWLAERGFTGERVNEPEPSYGYPLERAYTVAKDRLTRGVGFGGTAVFCVTMPAALGLMRAMYEEGLQVGRDISICCAFDEGIARFLCPPLTSVQMAPPEPLLRMAVEWMAGGEWEGPLFRRSPVGEIFAGDSTGAAPSEPAPHHVGDAPATNEQPPRVKARKPMARVSARKQQSELLQSS